MVNGDDVRLCTNPTPFIPLALAIDLFLILILVLALAFVHQAIRHLNSRIPLDSTEPFCCSTMRILVQASSSDGAL